MTTKYKLILFTFISILLTLSYINYRIPKKPYVILKCKGELIVKNKINGIDKNSRLATTNDVLLYSNGTGIIIQKGELHFLDKFYTVNREFEISFTSPDQDGVYAVTVTKGAKRGYDNIPANLASPHDMLSWKSLTLYVSITKLSEDVYLFKELGVPMLLCKNIDSK